MEKRIKKIITISSLLICFSCKTSIPIINSTLVNPLIQKWESSNLETFNSLNDGSKRFLDITTYVKRASKIKTIEGVDGYRKSLIEFVFNKFDIADKEFIIQEIHQFEHLGVTLFFENKKVDMRYQNGWSIIKKTFSDFQITSQRFNNFSRNNECLESPIFNLITSFSNTNIVSKVDDKDCQSIWGQY